MDNAQSTETNVVEAVEVPTVVRCRYCNRKGNSRRTYFNCAMNPAFVINAQPRDNIARNHDLQECEQWTQLAFHVALTCGSLRGRQKAVILNHDFSCAAPWEMLSFLMKVQFLTF
ncbi:hypothetical protein PS6_002243 [Mucor atramentarius]